MYSKGFPLVESNQEQPSKQMVIYQSQQIKIKIEIRYRYDFMSYDITEPKKRQIFVQQQYYLIIQQTQYTQYNFFDNYDIDNQDEEKIVILLVQNSEIGQQQDNVSSIINSEVGQQLNILPSSNQISLVGQQQYNTLSIQNNNDIAQQQNIYVSQQVGSDRSDNQFNDMNERQQNLRGLFRIIYMRLQRYLLLLQAEQPLAENAGSVS